MERAKSIIQFAIKEIKEDAPASAGAIAGATAGYFIAGPYAAIVGIASGASLAEFTKGIISTVRKRNRQAKNEQKR